MDLRARVTSSNSPSHSPVLVVSVHPAYLSRTFRAQAASPSTSPQQQLQAQQLQSQLSPHELAYQESLIQEREGEIREIESGIHELSEIFRDLGTLVNEQGGMIGTSF